jgi:hypothetical protein
VRGRGARCGGARSSRRSRVHYRMMRRSQVRHGSGFGVMQRLRSVQRRGADGADGEEQEDNMYRPYSELLHPVNNPSKFGSRAARSPVGAALRSIHP